MSKIVKVIAIVAVAVAVIAFAPEISGFLANVALSAGLTTVTGAFALASTISTALVGLGLATALSAGLSLFKKSSSINSATANRNSNVDPIAPRKIIFGRTLGGNDVRFEETYGNKSDNTVQVVALASHRLSNFLSFYIEDVLTSSDGHTVSGKYAKGFNSFQVVKEGKYNNGYAIGSHNYWTSSATFTGCAYYTVDYKLNDTWSGGVPTTTRVIVEGCPVYDPRLDSTVGGSGSHRSYDNTTWAFYNGASEIGRNPALCLLTYILGYTINGKLAWGMGIPISRINIANFITYANMCEEQVATQAGGLVTRYTCDGILQTSDSHESNIGNIVGCMGLAKFTDVGGLYGLVGGHDDTLTPVFELTDDDLTSVYTWACGGNSVRDCFNIVRGRFCDPNNLYQLIDYPEIDTAPLADGVQRVYQLDLPMVTRPETAQRIAKQAQAGNALTPGILTGTWGPKAFMCQVGGLVAITNREQGWVKKLFRVTAQAETHDLQHQMTLQEESAAVYGWDRNEQPLPYNLRPGGYDPSMVTSVAGLAVTSTSAQGANNVNVSLVSVTWTPETSGRVSGIQIQSQVDGSSVWTEQCASFDPTLGTYSFTSTVPGSLLHIQARYRMMTGIYGPWTSNVDVQTTAVVPVTDWQNVTDSASTRPANNATVGAPAGTYVAGTLAETLVQTVAEIASSPALDTIAPDTPTGLTISSTLSSTGTTTSVTLSWVANTESDLAAYEVEVATNGGNMVGMGSTTTASMVIANIAPNTTIAAHVRAVDIAGNRSAFSATVTATTIRDTTPPAPPTALTVSPGINSVILSVTAPGDADVAAIRFLSATSNDSSKAGGIGTTNAIAGRSSSKSVQQATGSTIYYWATALDTSGNEGAPVGPVVGTTYSVSQADFTPGLSATQTVTSATNLPASTGSGRLVYVANEAKTYRDTSTGWRKDTDGADITTGSIQAAAIASGAITASKIGVLGASLFPDGQVTDASWWTSNPTGKAGGGQNIANAFYIDNNPAPDVVAFKGSLNAWVTNGAVVNGSTAGNIQIFAPAIGGVIPGEWYEAKSTMFNSSNRPSLTMVLNWLDGSGNFLTNYNVGTTCVNDGTSRAMTIKAQAPAGAASYRMYWDGNGSTAAFTGQLYIGGITFRQCGTGSLIVDGTIVASNLAAGAITADKIAAGQITGDKISTTTSLPGSITIGNSGVSISTVQSTASNANDTANSANTAAGNAQTAANNAQGTANDAQGKANNPAPQINANSTLIQPGKIQLTGGTTLTNWLYGGDNTLINGGSIATNTIRANQIAVGLRGITFNGLQFDTDRGNTISWSAGTISYIGDDGNWHDVGVSSGSATYNGSPIYIWWPQNGAQLLSGTTHYTTASDVQIAVWNGGTGGMNVTYGQTIVDGDLVKTNTLQANRLIAGTVTAREIAGGTITGDRLAANTVTASQIASGAITADTIHANTIIASKFQNDAGYDIYGAVPGTLGFKLAGGDGSQHNFNANDNYGPYATAGGNFSRYNQIDITLSATVSGGGGLQRSGDPNLCYFNIYLYYLSGGWQQLGLIGRIGNAGGSGNAFNSSIRAGFQCGDWGASQVGIYVNADAGNTTGGSFSNLVWGATVGAYK